LVETGGQEQASEAGRLRIVGSEKRIKRSFEKVFIDLFDMEGILDSASHGLPSRRVVAKSPLAALWWSRLPKKSRIAPGLAGRLAA
jgi:hypothetical protein